MVSKTAKLTKTTLNIYTVILLLLVILLRTYINLGRSIIFIYFGLFLIPIGVAGLTTNSIMLTRGEPLELSENSLVGKIINTLISLSGIISIILYFIL